VVDDEVLLRMLIVDALEERGLQAEEAGNYRQALEKIQSLGDQLAGAIIDLGLPDRPGDELVASIRAKQPRLPVILATGYAGEEIRQQFAQDEFLQIVGKPFDPGALMAKLASLGVRLRKSN
jgi:CheY-like chemotaxis protein